VSFYAYVFVASQLEAKFIVVGIRLPKVKQLH